jgi:hypothetical protein
MSITLEISDELANKIKTEAKIRGIAIEDYLRSIIQKEVTLTERQKIEEEQNWWLNLPLNERAKYEGQYVAIHNKTLIDHDSDKEALHRRIRSKYGKEAILMMPAEGPRDIYIRSPRLERE